MGYGGPQVQNTTHTAKTQHTQPKHNTHCQNTTHTAKTQHTHCQNTTHTTKIQHTHTAKTQNTQCQNPTNTSKDCAHAPCTVQVKMADEEEAIRYYFSRNYDYATILNFLE